MNQYYFCYSLLLLGLFWVCLGWFHFCYNQQLILKLKERMGCTQSIVSEVPTDINDLIFSKRLKVANLSLQQSRKKGQGIYISGKRGKMKLEISGSESFLLHHLQNQINLSPYATSRKIRARQIIQHYIFSDLSHSQVGGQLATSKLTEFAMKAWFQRTFIECLQKAERGYFLENRSYDEVRQQLAEEYIFQIYQMGEFINAGFGKFSDGKSSLQVPLSLIMLNSDSALFPLLNTLQSKYPLVDSNENISFPDVQIINNPINLLDLIKSKSYQDPQHLNIQTLFHDLQFIIDKANQNFNNFQKDMQYILGEGVMTDCKVKSTIKQSTHYYNASAVRRVFIKWSQTMIQSIPDIFLHPEYVDFIRWKKIVANQFIFKSTVSPTTHQQVIKCLSLLLESVKYQAGTSKPRDKFGLFIYDLLRCKTTRKTGEQVVQLLEKMKATVLTPSGQRFEVTRIKNRFKGVTRDLLINFRYGQHLVAQAQLCIDKPHESETIAKNIKFRHYLYELQRGLFGPTFQMIMQYQDSSRKDILVDLQAEGKIQLRKQQLQPQQLIKRAGRKCPQQHEMIAIKGNIFGNDKLIQLVDSGMQTNTCDFCYDKFSIDKQYHYCYYCTLFYCLKCVPAYNSADRSKIQIVCTRNDLLVEMASIEDIEVMCRKRKSVIVVFYREGRPTSKLFMDQIVYLLCSYLSIGKAIPPIYKVNMGGKLIEDVLRKYKLTKLPTTLILNEEAEPVVQLIGCTFHDIEALFQVQRKVEAGLKKGLGLKCEICTQAMSCSGQFQSNKDQKCQICMDSNKIQDFEDLIRAIKIKTKDFTCKNGHIRCNYCSYLSSDQPSYFQDKTGRSYLSNRLFIKPPFCSNDHLMIVTSQPPSFNCYRCREYIGEMSSDEVGYCQQCKQYMCIECLQTSAQSFREQRIKESLKYIEIVSHYVESKAEQTYPCGCGKLFLKVYQSRKIDNFKNNFLFKNLLMQHKTYHWNCYVCGQDFSKLRLHLACFYCAFAQQNYSNTKVAHTEICVGCGIRSGLVGRELQTKIINQQTSLKCKLGHNIIKTTEKRGQRLSFSCIGCKQYYFPRTLRYHCQSCNINCCLTCRDSYLIDQHPPSTTKLCQKGHTLKCMVVKPQLSFCCSCKEYIAGKHFKCSGECNYHICMKCAGKQ